MTLKRKVPSYQSFTNISVMIVTILKNPLEENAAIALIRIHSMQAEQPLEGMELQEKEALKDQSIQEICLERTYS